MARPSKAVMAAKAKSKALLASDWQSSVPGVFFIAVGEPRWAARIRWQKDNAVYRDKTHVWKLSISPKTGGYTEKDLLHWQKQAEAWAEAEWLALEKSKKQFSRSAQASSWTLEMLLTKYLKGLDDESIKYRSCASDRSRVRVLLGIAEKGANAHNKAFAPVLGKTMDELAPTDFYTERPKSHPRAILLHYKGRNGQPPKNNACIKLIQTIRTVMGHAIREWGLDLDLTKVPLPPIAKDPGRDETLTEEEFGWIMDEMKECDQATRDVVVMNRHSAMRRSEAVKLDWERVTADNTAAKLTNTKSRRVKGKDLLRERTVPFAPAVVEMLARRREASDTQAGAVFLTAAGNRIWPDAVTKAWERARRRAARKHNRPDMLNKRLHDLRHTRITELGEDMPAAMIAKMSGHDDLASFMRYFNPKPEAIRRKMAEADRRRLASGGTGGPSAVETAVAVLSELSPEEMAQVMAMLFTKKAAA